MRSGKVLLPSAASPRLIIWASLGAIALSLSTLTGFARDHALLINVSPSLPYWAIWLDRGANPARGEIILFDPPPSDLLTNHFGLKPKPFGKRVVGMPGDRVTQQARTYFINGKPVAKAKMRSMRGEPLALGPTGILPTGCFFVATEHPDGFDSRYAAIGWICRPRILGVGRPIL
jgi:conjugal transfer pilin signal peptidase TrbI